MIRYFLLTFVTFVGCSDPHSHARGMKFDGAAGFFAVALDEYKKDAKKSNLPKEKWYPDRLEQLVEKNIISQAALENNIKEFEIVYMKPNSKTKNPVVLIVLSDKVCNEIFTDGSIQKQLIHRYK